MRETFGARGGTEIDTQGDAFFFSFPRARDAVAAADRRAARAARHDGRRARRCACGWACTPASRTSARRATSGSTSCARRGSRPPGHGGQILVSETTRALLGNQLPDGVAVHDLGEQNLKDVQHEHIYEISARRRARAQPLKTGRAEGPSTADELRVAVRERIHAYVERQLDQALGGGTPPQLPTKLLGGAVAFGLGTLLALAVVVIAIVLLVKVAFF